nr:nickel insertion protein [uncultured Oscillibacter sp.]
MVCKLSCNVDNMTAEAVGFAMDWLFEAGALEVHTIPVGMKKSRPGTLICALCQEQDREVMTAKMLRHTTIGVQETACCRYVLEQDVQTVETPCGTVHRKDFRGYGVTCSKYEYENLARIAKERNIRLTEAKALVEGC